MSLLAITSVAALVALQAEPLRTVRLAPRIEPDHTLAYRIEHDTEIDSVPDEGDSRVISLHHAADFRLVPRRIEHDGSVSLAIMFDTIEIDIDAGGEPRTFEWSRADAAGGPADEESDARRAGQVLATTIPIVSVDAGGRVIGIEGLDPFLDESTTLGDEAPLFAGMFTPDGLARTVETIVCADGSARVAVREIGSAWQTVRVSEMPPVGEVKIVTDWSLSSDDAVATITGVSRHAIIESTHDDAATPGANILNSDSNTSVRWDLRANELMQRRTEQSITSRWTLGSRSVTQTQRSTQTVTRLESSVPDEP